VRVALDSNILLYAQGFNDLPRRQRAEQALGHLIEAEIIIPAQALGGVFAVLTRKFGQTQTFARGVVVRWQEAYAIAPTTERVLLRATDLATDHRLGIWDAVIFAAAAEAGCSVLLSEDMQHGFLWGGVQVINPFQSAGWTQLQALVAAK
jgi:predicted nucleic acid-binding protein